MSDAELIYNAYLRAERRLDDAVAKASKPFADEIAKTALISVRLIREEIGNGLALEAKSGFQPPMTDSDKSRAEPIHQAKTR